MYVQGTLFPMCGMNLAFNRELIGPAMYFGLMGDGQPLGRYDDMWAGWCSKVCPTEAIFLEHAHIDACRSKERARGESTCSLLMPMPPFSSCRGLTAKAAPPNAAQVCMQKSDQG